MAPESLSVLFSVISFGYPVTPGEHNHLLMREARKVSSWLLLHPRQPPPPPDILETPVYTVNKPTPE